MQRWECVDGPYLQWVKSVQAKVGKRVWESICNMDAKSADSIMAAMGIKPFWESEFAQSRECKQILVTHVTSDWLRPIPGEPQGPTVHKWDDPSRDQSRR